MRELEELFLEIAHKFKRLDMGCLSEDMSESEMIMLEVIGQYEDKQQEKRGIYVSDLAQLLRVSTPAVSRMLRFLEERRLIVRVVDEQNRRNICVNLTESGRLNREQSLKRRREFLDRVAKRMGKEEMERMLHQLIRMSDIIWDELQKENDKVKNLKKHKGAKVI